MPKLIIEQLKRDGINTTSLTIDSNSCTSIYGSSGSGKTLLLRAIADLDCNTGEVSLGEHIRSNLTAEQWRKKVAYIPTDSFWWGEKVNEHCSQWNIEILSNLGFDTDVLNWTVSHISSGEKQRLALARALSIKPQALLLDEPTANLDHDNTLKAEAVISEYQQQHKSPILWVSHDPLQRARISKRHIEIIKGQLQSE